MIKQIKSQFERFLIKKSIPCSKVLQVIVYLLAGFYIIPRIFIGRILGILRRYFLFGSFLIIIGAILFTIIFLLSPINFEKVYFESVPNLELFKITVSKSTAIVVRDSSVCSDYKYGACVEKKCSYSLVSYTDFDCSYSLNLNQPIKFDKFVIDCGVNEQCQIKFTSDNFKSNNLFLFGFDMNVKALQITTSNLFFDSYKGSLKIQKLTFDKAAVNTSLGDIVIQTLESVQLTAKTSKKYICTTCSQGWRDSTTVINSLMDEFKEKDADKQECFIVYDYQSRKQEDMVANGIHSVLEQVNPQQYFNQDEVRCQTIDNVILMNNKYNPSTVTNFKTILAGNHEGNIYLNVLSNNNSLEKQLINSEYQNNKIQFSKQSSTDLKETIKSIIDQGKNNEIVYLDFRSSNDYIENFVFVLIFNPIFLHFSTEWLSALSFNSLSNEEQILELSLNPGLCPFIYSYSMIEDSSLQSQFVSQREETLRKLLESFLESEELDIYLVTTWLDYKSFNLRDQSTYPDIKNISNSIKIVISSEIICIVVLIFFIGLTWLTIFVKINNFIESKQIQDRQKVIFFLFQKNLMNFSLNQNNESSPKSPALDSPLIKCLGSQESEDLEEKEQMIKDQQNKQNSKKKKNQIFPEKEQQDEVLLIPNQKIKKIKLSCEIHLKNLLPLNLFQPLATLGFSWLLSRYINSYHLFMYQLSSYNTSQEKQRVKTQLTAQEFQSYYQKFCYLLNLQEECYSLEYLEYDEYIVFKKLDKSNLKQGQTLIYLSRAQKQHIRETIKDNEQFKDEMQISQYVYLVSQSENKRQERKNEQDNVQNSNQNANQKESQQQNILKKNPEVENSTVNIELSPQQPLQNEINEQFNKSDGISPEPQMNVGIQHIPENNNQNVVKSIEEKSQQGKKQEDLEKQQDEKQLILKQRLSYLEFQNSDFDENLLDIDDNDEDEDFYIYTTKNKIFQINYCFYGEYQLIHIKEEFLKYIDDFYESFLENTDQNNSILAEISSFKDEQPDKKWLESNQQNIKDLSQKEIKDKYIKMKKSEIQEKIGRYKGQKINEKQWNNKSALAFLLFRYQFIYLLYISSPIWACFTIFVFIFIYMKQEDRFKIERYGENQDISLISQIFDFSHIGISLAIYTCIIFILYFYYYLVGNNITDLTKNSKSIFSGNFKIIKNYDDIKETKSRKSKCKYFKQFYQLITHILFIVQVTYLSIAFLILVVGTIIFPRVQLPTLIFFGVLLGVVINSIVTFQNQYQIGVDTIKQLFVDNFRENCKKLNKEEIQMVDCKKELTSNQIKKDSDKINEQPLQNKNDQKNKNENKVVRIKGMNRISEGKYNDIFHSLEGSSDLEITEKEFKQFLKDIDMSLNQVQLDQLYAYLYSIDNSSYSLQIWKIHKNMGTYEFEQAIEYLLNKKVNYTLNLLDISYASLCLSIIKTIFQSVAIAWIIYSVYSGFSSSDISFDFSANSVVSLGGVLGIVFSKESKEKIFEDKKLIKDTIDKVEAEMHSCN